jgi:MFS family permease
MPLINYSFLSKILPKAKIIKSYRKAKETYLSRIRWATSFFFFGKGFCFATWASRIPDIKENLNLSEASLGALLFLLPIGQLVAMPFSGNVVTKYGSRNTAIIGLLFYALCLPLIGFTSNIIELSIALFLFGFTGNFSNIAVNTQGVYTQQLYEKPIVGSFHGWWSLAGFCGALFGLIMVSFQLNVLYHFCISFGLVALIVLFNYAHLIKAKAKKQLEKSSYSFLKNPNMNLVCLGVICFFCMASEGIMFDWSGVYFKEIVKAPGGLVVLGYTTFMISMAVGRFLSDYLVFKYGAKKVLMISGIVISIGLYIAVLFPNLYACTFAFMLVGFGVSNVVPITFNAAGNVTEVPPGIALTIVTSISFLGFLLGPPIIGFIAELTSLQYSFAFIGVFGIFITFLVKKLKVF